ncbi:class I SAM-dependent methyltransferase [Gordonia sp. CPCC 205515]|uniref:class I SAM-dependent methyltransferase n=1 Tax=Gordonia sp. CPCC 205515 TaxID=3140791 RepID=UPI003AF3CA5F
MGGKPYGSRASEYIDLFGSINATSPLDRDFIGSWAAGVYGPILDVGCGPGHWTSWLTDNGCDVVGIDPVVEFVDHARRAFPRSSYRLGSAEDLDVSDAEVGGILAWYSLIHLAPNDIDAVFDEFARALRPGGTVLIGFFESSRVALFDHAVTTAYFWPIHDLSHRLRRAGFAVTATQSRHDPGARPHGAIVARKHEQPTHFTQQT